jgi:hypothetical protein
MIQYCISLIFCNIGRNCLLRNRQKIDKFIYFLYDQNLTHTLSTVTSQIWLQWIVYPTTRCTEVGVLKKLSLASSAQLS